MEKKNWFSSALVQKIKPALLPLMLIFGINYSDLQPTLLSSPRPNIQIQLADTLAQSNTHIDEDPVNHIGSKISVEQEQGEALFEIFKKLWMNHPLVANFFAKNSSGVSNWDDIIANYHRHKDIFDKYEWVLYLIPGSSRNFARGWTMAESALNETAWSSAGAQWFRQFTSWTMQNSFRSYGAALKKQYPDLVTNDPKNGITSLLLSSEHLHKDLCRDWELDQSLGLIWYHGWIGAKNTLRKVYQQSTGEELVTMHQIYAMIPPDDVIKYFATKKDNHEIYPMQVFAGQYICDVLWSWDGILHKYSDTFKQSQVTTSKRMALDDIWYKGYDEQNENLVASPKSKELQYLLSVLEDLADQAIKPYNNADRYKRSKFTLDKKEHRLSVRAILAWQWIKFHIPQDAFSATKLRIILQYMTSYGLCTFSTERLPWWQLAYSIGLRKDLTIKDISHFASSKNHHTKTPQFEELAQGR